MDMHLKFFFNGTCVHCRHNYLLLNRFFFNKCWCLLHLLYYCKMILKKLSTSTQINQNYKYVCLFNTTTNILFSWFVHCELNKLDIKQYMKTQQNSLHFVLILSADVCSNSDKFLVRTSIIFLKSYILSWFFKNDENKKKCYKVSNILYEKLLKP